MMIGNIILITWVVLWVICIHPVYKFLLKVMTIDKSTGSYNISTYDESTAFNKPTDVFSAAAAVVFATILGACWPIIIPASISRFIWRRNAISPSKDAQAAVEDLNERAELKRLMDMAMKELTPVAESGMAPEDRLRNYRSTRTVRRL